MEGGEGRVGGGGGGGRLEGEKTVGVKEGRKSGMEVEKVG